MGGNNARIHFGDAKIVVATQKIAVGVREIQGCNAREDFATREIVSVLQNSDLSCRRIDSAALRNDSS